MNFDTYLYSKHIPFCKRVNIYVQRTPKHRLISDNYKFYTQWANIDREKDKSLSAEDFKFWLYLRLINKYFNQAFN